MTAAALAVRRNEAEVLHQRLSCGTMARMIQDEAVEGMYVRRCKGAQVQGIRSSTSAPR
jgi:hypothetical protein